MIHSAQIFVRKLNSARYRWNQFKKRAQERRQRARERRTVAQWFRLLRTRPPDVLVGGNFDLSGGVRNHIVALQRFSQLRLEFAPPDDIYRSIGVHKFIHQHGDLLDAFDATCLSAVHSHVYPKFIRWCENQQRKGAFWVHTYHLNYFPEHAKDALLDWQREINHALIHHACHADVKISVSQWQRDELREQYNIDTIYIPNGVNVEHCDQGRAERFREKTLIEAPFILFVGRDDPVKNPAELINLAARMPDHQFVMIGHGLLPELVRQRYPLEVPTNLHLHGPESHLGVQDALAACQCVVVTSKREGLPTLVLEAMAHQKPVVVPQEKGCVEAIDFGTYGFIYELGNLQQLVQVTEQACQDSQKCRLSRQRILQEYDWRVVMPKMDQLYQHQSPDAFH